MKSGATADNEEAIYRVESDRPPEGDDVYDAATRVGPHSYQALASLLKDRGSMNLGPKPGVEEPQPTSRTQFVEPKHEDSSPRDDEPPMEATRLMPQAPTHPAAQPPLPLLPIPSPIIVGSAAPAPLSVQPAPPPQPLADPIPIPQVPEASWANPNAVKSRRPRYLTELMIGAIVFVILSAPAILWILFLRE